MKDSTFILITTIIMTIVVFSLPFEHLPHDGDPPTWAESYAAELDEHGGKIILYNNIKRTVKDYYDVTYNDEGIVISYEGVEKTIPYYKIRMIYVRGE